ncbi:hypothetical protein FVE85_5518 [Porphyridium purpureum]|uniref:ThuA-like domain-containing protein n=1 Tax=Porphyridium purpureum TaxID=35688 RepID=A0A5J4Z4T7_PORPP|nr:hypothetical protein FVE85_5518 [Porphyridium purpureum]|eukprot:POR6776..scf295_1
MEKRVLLFFKATEYYHESIPDAICAFLKIARRHGIGATATDDASLFKNLQRSKYQAVVFVSNSGELFNDEEKAGLVNYVEEQGGAILGLHGALASFLNVVDHSGATPASGTWDWYGDLLQAYFRSHPPIQTGVVRTNKSGMEALGICLPAEYELEDEWYNYDRNPAQNAKVTVLAWADESTYQGGEMGETHPVIWYHRFGPRNSKVFFTALGHLDWHYKLESHVHVLEKALLWLLTE